MGPTAKGGAWEGRGWERRARERRVGEGRGGGKGRGGEGKGPPRIPARSTPMVSRPTDRPTVCITN